ncbi:hypothetical protein ACLOJK_036470 [Asimina triloba]
MLMEAWTIGIDGEATLDDEELRMLLRFATDLESEIDFVAALVLLGTAAAHLLGSLLALEMDGLLLDLNGWIGQGSALDAAEDQPDLDDLLVPRWVLGMHFLLASGGYADFRWKVAVYRLIDVVGDEDGRGLPCPDLPWIEDDAALDRQWCSLANEDLPDFSMLGLHTRSALVAW